MPADAVLEGAVDLAREVAIEAADDAVAVGEYLGFSEDGERIATHQFACTLAGYRGWVWSVTLARAPRAKEPTVCEAALVPTGEALLAPAWIPWAERLQPGDLEPAMVLPFVKDDVRLVPGYEATGDEDADALAIWELGLGRERVLGPEGRVDVAERWYRGSHGPTAASAIASTAPCQTCAFYLPLTGSMRLTFGACTNEWSPSDGKVVSVDHGCGAHSQTDVDRQSSMWPAPDPVIETDSSVVFDLSQADPEQVVEPEPDEAPEPDAAPESAPEPDAAPESVPEAEPTRETEVTPGPDSTEPAAPDAPEAPREANPAV